MKREEPTVHHAPSSSLHKASDRLGEFYLTSCGSTPRHIWMVTHRWERVTCGNCLRCKRKVKR